MSERLEKLAKIKSLGINPYPENFERTPRLGTKLNTLDLLEKIPLSLACLANNHIADNLEFGLKNTLEKLDSLSIEKVGASLQAEENI